MIDIAFLEQLIESMEDATNRLETAVAKEKYEDANRLRTFIFDLHRQISVAVGGAKNV